MFLFYFLFIINLVAPFLLAASAAPFDNKRISENGSKDNKHDTFHRQNLTRRTLWLMPTTAFNVYLAWGDKWLAIGLIISYGFYCAGIFGYFFTSWLNLKRGLNRWYISLAPKAAKTDKTIREAATWFGESPATFASWLYPITMALGCGQYLLVLYWIFFK